jgi:biopolymer transport protein ExbD
MRHRTLFINFTTFLVLTGCSNGNQNDRANSETPVPGQEQISVDSKVIKVYVEQDGKISADGKEISLSNLDSSFSVLKKSNGTVYYSRASGLGDPPQESMKVMELIVKYSLPIKLFTDKTFTVVVKPN